MQKEQVTEIRVALGLTPEALGELLGTHRTTVQRWERGVWEVPPAASLALEALKARAKTRKRTTEAA